MAKLSEADLSKHIRFEVAELFAEAIASWEIEIDDRLIEQGYPVKKRHKVIDQAMGAAVSAIEKVGGIDSFSFIKTERKALYQMLEHWGLLRHSSSNAFLQRMKAAENVKIYDEKNRH